MHCLDSKPWNFVSYGIATLLLIFPVLASGQSTPFGYQIGKEITNADELSEQQGQGFISDRWYVDTDVRFFDKLEIEVDEGDLIQTISALKTYSVSLNNVRALRSEIKDDFFELVSRLEDQYGPANKDDAQRIYGRGGDTNSFYLYEKAEETVSIKTPGDPNIAQIYIGLLSEESSGDEMLEGSEVSLHLLYLSSSGVEKIEQRSEERFDEL